MIIVLAAVDKAAKIGASLVLNSFGVTIMIIDRDRHTDTSRGTAGVTP